MKIQMMGKWNPEQFHVRSFEIELAPEDLGLEQPTSEEEFKSVLAELMYKARYAVEMFYVKDGLHSKEDAVQVLKVFKP